MTLGHSNTVVEFLKKAAERSISVIVAESAPSFSGRITAQKLAETGIDTTLISDSSIFAMMARVNKVVVGTHAAMANGGLIALTGTHMLAQAAKFHSVPFVVCVGTYKICPLYHSTDQDNVTDLNSPSQILTFEEGSFFSPSSSRLLPPSLLKVFQKSTKSVKAIKKVFKCRTPRSISSLPNS